MFQLNVFMILKYSIPVCICEIVGTKYIQITIVGTKM